MGMKKWEYRGRRALVTGASAGIGEAFARKLAERGMDLALVARREGRLRELAAELEERHRIDVRIIPADLGEPGAAVRVWDAATLDGEVHLVVNNAGFGADGRFDEIERDRQVEMVQLNITALLELCHLALPGMRERGDGGIINVASTAAFQPIPRFATYSASKTFVLNFSEALWAENRAAGVRVLALCPGRTPTEFQEVAGTKTVTRLSPGHRTPEQVVDAGLRALEKGHAFEVPGLTNYLGTFAGRLLPRQLLLRGMLKVRKHLV